MAESQGSTPCSGVVISAAGGPEVLQWRETLELPAIREHEVLIETRFAGVNRHDCNQRRRGPTPAQRAAVRERLRAVAKGVGLDVAKPDCTPNLLVMVAADKNAFVKALGKDHNYMFGDRTPAQVRKILAEPGPATAWQIQTMVNGDGRAVANEGDMPVNRTTRNPSRITAAARPAFLAAAVVIDGAALDGLTTTQLADYAAMRALARIDPARIDAAAPSTILRILDAASDSEVPVTLTQWDFAFLKGLYSSPDNLYAPSQRSEIERTMNEEFDRAGSEGAPPRDKSPG